MLLRNLRHAGALRRARVDRRGPRDATRLIIAVGQIHPVLTGRFSTGTAKLIGRTQAWIYRFCTALHDIAGIHRFGQEGFGGQEDARIAGHLLEQLQGRMRGATVDAALRDTALAWARALHRGDMERAAAEAAILNGLAPLQIAHTDVAAFGIEHAGIHGSIGAAIDELHARLQQCDASAPYRAAVMKEGKQLTQEEYEALQKHNALVQAYNRTLASPERDRAMFQRIMERARGAPCTVFILGQAHRRAFLRLARRHAVPEGIAFLWVTPPQLWWWRAMLRRAAWLAAVGIIVIALWQLRGA